MSSMSGEEEGTAAIAGAASSDADTTRLIRLLTASTACVCALLIVSIVMILALQGTLSAKLVGSWGAGVGLTGMMIPVCYMLNTALRGPK